MPSYDISAKMSRDYDDLSVSSLSQDMVMVMRRNVIPRHSFLFLFEDLKGLQEFVDITAAEKEGLPISEEDLVIDHVDLGNFFHVHNIVPVYAAELESRQLYL